MIPRSLLHAFADQIEIILDNWKPCRFSTHRLDFCGYDKRVVFENISCFEYGSYWNQFCSCWEDRHFRFSRNFYLLVTRSGNRAQIGWPQCVTRRQDQLCCDNVLAQWSYMTPRWDTGTNTNVSWFADVFCNFPMLIKRFNIFDWNDGVRPIRQRITRIHIVGFRSDLKRHRFGW